jgi:polyhydroxyalkanoate synthesis regulator phasin
VEERELLQAILSKMKSFKEETNERFDRLEQDIHALQEDMTLVKQDVKETNWKVDVLYDRVDGLDLKVRHIDGKVR